MREKRYVRQMTLYLAILAAVYLAVRLLSGMIIGKEFIQVIDLNRIAGFDREVLGEAGGEKGELDSIRPELEYRVDDEEILQVEEMKEQSGQLQIRLRGLKGGETTGELIWAKTGEVLRTNFYRVHANGMVLDLENGNFSSYRIYALYLLLALAFLTLLLWVGFVKSRRELGYSYYSIFCLGFGVWMTVVVSRLFWLYVQGRDMLILYSSLQEAAYEFSWVTLPFVCGFALALALSNLALIRHEGFSFTNMLGILLAVLLVGAGAVLTGLSGLDLQGSEFYVHGMSALLESAWSVYALGICFLMGAVVNGLLAARHKPSGFIDYLIILGCRIREDGSLYPLLQGRVDRAIEVYRKQEEKTGEKAYFVPSGGQGSDEVISEAQAMKRYLAARGIPEEYILTEDRSVNTQENMCFSRSLIEAHCRQLGKENGTIAFSTTNYHVFRSGIISRQQDFYPEGLGSKTKWYFWPNAFVREMVGMAVYTRRLLVILAVLLVVFMAALQFVF